MKTKNETLFELSQQIIPGGVNSPVRAFRSVGGTPVFFERAKGAYFWDADGKRYIDYVGSWGPLVLGHAHPEVVEAVQRAAERGLSFGAPTEAEQQMAQLLIDLLPSLEMVRLVSSGTEATMTAIRLARGFTGRSRIVKFEGCYHGHADALLVKAGSGALTLGVPSSAGVPPEVTAHTLVLDYNDLDGVRRAFDQQGREIAAVIVEPVVGNMNLVHARARIPRGAARAVHAPRGGVDLRRSDDRIPGRAARGAGTARHSTRSDHAGQGRRRRDAARGLRRTARHHAMHRAARARVSGGNVVGQPGGGGGRSCHAEADPGAGVLRAAVGGDPQPGARAAAGRARRPVWGYVPSRWGGCSESISRRARHAAMRK